MGLKNSVEEAWSKVKDKFSKAGDWWTDTFNQLTGKANVEEARRANEATLASNSEINNASLATQARINQDNIIAQKEINDQQVALTREANAFEREKFEYDQYLNANQNQIAADDRSKAGLNPIGAANLSTVGVGGMQTNVGSAPVSQASAQLHPTNFIAGQYDTTFLSNAMTAGLNRWTAKENNNMVKKSLDNEMLKLNLEHEDLLAQLDETKRHNKEIERLTGSSNSNQLLTNILKETVNLALGGASPEDIFKMTGYQISDDIYNRLKKLAEANTDNIVADTAKKAAETSNTTVDTGLKNQLFNAQHKMGDTPLDMLKYGDITIGPFSTSGNIPGLIALGNQVGEGLADTTLNFGSHSDAENRIISEISAYGKKYSVPSSALKSAVTMATRGVNYNVYASLTNKNKEIPKELYLRLYHTSKTVKAWNKFSNGRSKGGKY